MLKVRIIPCLDVKDGRVVKGVRFVDLDTPLWLAKNPTRGIGFGRGGVYDLSGVKAGIGVVPLDG